VNVWDVVVIGGGIAGASTAMRLLEANGAQRILILDRGDKPNLKIGESTVEVSSYFLGRTLNLTDYLSREHITKQGLRFWFQNQDCTSLEDCSEIGPAYHVNLPSYQVDRTKLDAEVLRRAVAQGAELWRPARVRSVELESGGLQTVRVKSAGEELEVQARWVVDASGPARFLARQEGWVRPNLEHPVSSIWGRYKAVKNWDDAALRLRFPQYSRRCHGSRNTATNHIMGDGWWSWWIFLESGEVSVGVVYDERIVKFPESVTGMEARLHYLLDTSPVANEMLQAAELVPDSVIYRGQVAYCAESIAGDGYSIVGDAAGFMDPFYSPGLDWVAYTTSAAVDLIDAELDEQPRQSRIKEINTVYLRSYRRWFAALYQDKYIYLGDFELMRMAFLSDLAGYYYGVVRPLYKEGARGFLKPIFGHSSTTLPYLIVSAYHRRLVQMAKSRRARGVFGRHNRKHYVKIISYTLDWRLPVRMLWNLRIWLYLELTEGWRTWFKSVRDIAPAQQLRRGE